MRPVTRRARAILGVLAASMALVVVTGPVAAASPQPVTIDSHVTFNPDGPNSGDFSVSGAAADGGLVCAGGTFVDTAIGFAGYQSDRGGPSVVQLQVRKTFTCADGSGTFFVKMQIQADVATGLETFTWVAQGGTGDYGKLRGSGSGSTVRDEDGNATPTPTPGSWSADVARSLSCPRTTRARAPRAPGPRSRHEEQDHATPAARSPR